MCSKAVVRASKSSPSAQGIHFQEKLRLRSAIFNQKWRRYSAVVSLESRRPSHNYTHTHARGGCWCQILMRILSLPRAPGMLKTLFPFLSVIIIIFIFPHLAKALDKTIELCLLDWFKSTICWDGWWSCRRPEPIRNLAWKARNLGSNGFLTPRSQ